MVDPLVLNFEQIIHEGHPRRIIFPCHPTLTKEVRTGEGIFFEFARGTPVPEPVVLDGFLFCFLFAAMERGVPLVIRGPVSARAIRNARLFQEAWASWVPSRYRIVDIIPDQLVSERCLGARDNAAAVAAFSGGVDSTFSAMRHGRRMLGRSSHEVEAVLTVQGFDVNFENYDGFQRLLDRTQPLIDDLGLRRHVMRTNIRQYELQNWGHSHGAQISCALHQLSHEFNYGLIASSRPYKHLINAWGSHAATDHLLSGDDLEIVHDGAGFLRVQKVKLIASDPVAQSSLKVCWEGREQDKNCGHCAKCVRTRLNFLALGEVNPPCFDSPFELDMIDDLKVDSEGALIELLNIIEYARQSAIEKPWVSLLERRVQRLQKTFDNQQGNFLKKERDDLRRKLKKQDKEITGLRLRLSDVYASTSWRFTRPLRTFSAGAKWLIRVIGYRRH